MGFYSQVQITAEVKALEMFKSKEISSRNFGKDFMEREVLCPPADWE